MKINGLELGSVALADALALARVHRVVLTGQAGTRLDAIARGQYPLVDPALDGYLQAHRLSLPVEPEAGRALHGADFVLVADPLPIGADTGKPMTAELDAAIATAVQQAPGAVIMVRSAVPVGHTDARRRAYPQARIVVAPEFSEPETPLSSLLAPPAGIPARPRPRTHPAPRTW